MNECVVDRAGLLDFREVERNMRPEDAAECYAAHLATPAMAIAECQRSASVAFAGRVNGETICVFGVSPAGALLDYGLPWMLGTDGVSRYAVPFLRLSGSVVEAMLETYPRLVNYVDARNKAAIRWLRWLGFVVEDAKPHGPFKRPFHRFTMERT